MNTTEATHEEMTMRTIEQIATELSAARLIVDRLPCSVTIFGSGALARVVASVSDPRSGSGARVECTPQTYAGVDAVGAALAAQVAKNLRGTRRAIAFERSHT